MTQFSQIDGYVADSAYPSKFHPHFQPPWIDAVLAMRGIVPPRIGGEPFTMVDLGCGDGVGLILAAASHPQGRFIGIDAMPSHIERGMAAIRGLGLTNIDLRCGGFSDLLDMADGTADYVTAQGVLAWISAENRCALYDLAGRWLKPGGAFCVGYNCYPGWGMLAPFQALVRAAAMALPGNSGERFSAACAQLRKSGAIADTVWEWLDTLLEDLPLSYFAHEYLNAHWQPCWSGDVIAALGVRGLAYVGQASNPRLRDDFCLTDEWQAALAEFASVPAREIAADLLLDAWFRRDIYLRMPGEGFDTHEAIPFRLATWWALADTLAPDVEMRSSTPAGEITFDNQAAVAIHAALVVAPATIGDISAGSGIGAVDLLNTLDAMFVAGLVMPIDGPATGVAADEIMRWLADNGYTINGRVTRFGAVLA